MFRTLRFRRWIKKLESKSPEQFQTEIVEAAKSILADALLKNRLDPSDPKAQVLMTGAMFTVLASQMEVPVQELYSFMNSDQPKEREKVGFQSDTTRGYL